MPCGPLLCHAACRHDLDPETPESFSQNPRVKRSHQDEVWLEALRSRRDHLLKHRQHGGIARVDCMGSEICTSHTCQASRPAWCSREEHPIAALTLAPALLKDVRGPQALHMVELMTAKVLISSAAYRQRCQGGRQEQRVGGASGTWDMLVHSHLTEPA